jgi:hypothetical protein
MADVDEGVMSIGSRGGGARVEPEDGRIGIDLWRFGFGVGFGLCGSGEKGLLRASATEVIMAGGDCGERRRC